MSEQHSFQDFLVRLKSGEKDAATEVFQRFASQLMAKARDRMSLAIQRKVDPEDVVQSVYRSFYRRFDDGQFSLETWESLWGLLLAITLRKCNKQRVYFLAEKRNVNREISGSENSDLLPAVFEGIDREPFPDEVVALEETVERLLSSCNPRNRDVLTLCIQGYSHQEVSRQVGCSERTVRRVIQFARNDLAEMEQPESRP